MSERIKAGMARGLGFLVRLYQLTISPFFAGACRYHPSCSTYAREALDCHGPFLGLWLTLRRLLRCHPWGGQGYDPIPGSVPERRALAPVDSAEL